jgi:hypothetical protein
MNELEIKKIRKIIATFQESFARLNTDATGNDWENSMQMRAT